MTPEKPIQRHNPPGIAGKVEGISIDLQDTVVIVGRKGGRISSHPLPIEKELGIEHLKEECLSCKVGYGFGSAIRSQEMSPSGWSWEPLHYLYGSDPTESRLQESPGSKEESSDKPVSDERDQLEEIREALRESRALGISARRGIESLKQRTPRLS